MLWRLITRTLEQKSIPDKRNKKARKSYEK